MCPAEFPHIFLSDVGFLTHTHTHLPQAFLAAQQSEKRINDTKVWLDVWDPDSGFHFPDREPGWCLFLLPSNFFWESWNNQTQTGRTQTKGQSRIVPYLLSSTETDTVGGAHQMFQGKKGMVKFSVRSLTLDTLHVSEGGK